MNDEEIKRALEEARRESEEQRDRINQLIIDRDGWQFRAEQKYRLRKELEDALGIEQDMSHDEALQAGLDAINSLRSALSDRSIEIEQLKAQHAQGLAGLREAAKWRVTHLIKEQGELSAKLAEAGQLADDLVALVRRLAHALRKATPKHALTRDALDYLERRGLGGSPLREALTGKEGE